MDYAGYRRAGNYAEKWISAKDNENIAAAGGRELDEAVTLSVSQRNAVSTDGEGAEVDGSMMSQLLESLTDAPESTSQLHAGLSPERVLQLLS